MTKLISILVVLLLIFCCFTGYKYWEKVRDEDESKNVVKDVNPEALAGFPTQNLIDSYHAAVKKSPAAVAAWLENYGNLITDPRKAWIQLDYCVSITRDNPAEAKRVFSEVKARLKPDSVVYPRIKQLEKTYE